MIAIKDHRCADEDCKKKKQCLRYLDLKAVDYGAPWMWRVCNKNKEDEMIHENNKNTDRDTGKV